MLYLSAAIFTLAAWGLQAYVTVIRKRDGLSLFLPLLYAATCILFMIDAASSGEVLYIILNAVLLIFLAVITVSLIRRKKDG